MLAYHYEKAGVTDKAVKYLQWAGDTRPPRLYANEEAIACFNRALRLLQDLPESPERDAQELGLQLGLFAPLTAARSWAAPEVGAACIRALELCSAEGERTPSPVKPSYPNFQAYCISRAEHQKALELSEELLQMAQHTAEDAKVISCRPIGA